MSTKTGSPSNPKAPDDNRSRQLNPENDAFWKSRGEQGRPPAEGGAETQVPVDPGKK